MTSFMQVDSKTKAVLQGSRCGDLGSFCDQCAGAPMRTFVFFVTADAVM